MANPCPKCGGTDIFATSDISESVWSTCKSCGYSEDYPEHKVIGWDGGSCGFPLFEEDREEIMDKIEKAGEFDFEKDFEIWL